MEHLISREAPDFIAEAVLGDNQIDPEFSLSARRGKYVILLFYPFDFSFVCPTEILAFNDQLTQFKERNTEVIGISVDSIYTHLAWKRTPLEQGGIGPIQYPLVSDLNKNIARSYGVLMDGGVALRGLFLIDRQGVVRHAILNDLDLGRSVAEALRLLDALRFSEQHGKVCPANWEKGQEGVTPTSRGVIDYLSKYAKRK